MKMRNGVKVHRAAVELRTTAVAFAQCGSPTDSKDSIGRRATRRLLLAALRYSKAFTA
jgi:hypothetical protein